jgi:hypothetical protein
VELDKLHVAQGGAGQEGERRPVTRVLVRAGRAAVVERGASAGGEQDGAGRVVDELSAPQVHGAGTAHPSLVHQQLGDHQVLAVRHARLGCLLDQRLEDRLAGPVAHEAGTTIGLRSEVPLLDGALIRALEVAPPLRQLLHPVRRILRQDLHGVGPADEVALLEGVRGVHLPPVLRIARAEDRVDAPGRPAGMGIAVASLADHQVRHAGPCELDCRPQPRGPRADDEDLGALRADQSHASGR